MSATHAETARELAGPLVDLLKFYGPGWSGWIIAILFFCVSGWLLSRMILQSSKQTAAQVEQMHEVWDVSEKLMQSMLRNVARCEDECKAKDVIIEQLKATRDELIRQHSMAREEFLQEAREREAIIARELAKNEELRVAAAAARGEVEALARELDEIRRGTRGEPR